TFSYSAGKLAGIAEPGGRALAFTVNGSGDLVGIVTADGGLRTLAYDTAHPLTNDRWGPLHATYSYDATNRELSRPGRGPGTTRAVRPANVQGLATSPAKSAAQAVGVLTDALTHATSYTLDGAGRLTKLQTADGATQSWQRDFAGQATAATDALNRTTSYTYQY